MSLPTVLKSLPEKKRKSDRHRHSKRVVYDVLSDDDVDSLMDISEPETVDLAAYAKKISKRAKEALLKSAAKRSWSDVSSVCSFGSFGVPSTPLYSQTSLDVRLERYPENVPRHGDAALMVAMLSITFLLQGYSHDIWIPLFEPALTAFPAWSQTSLGLITVWNIIVGLTLTIPTCVVINKYGIKTILLCSCVLSIFGAGVRLCLPLLDDSTSMVHASTVFLSCASVVVRPLTATVCTCCFRHGERNLATAILTSSSMIGTAFGFLFRMLSDSSPSKEHTSPAAYWKSVVMVLMYTIFIVNVLWTFLVFVFFPQESQNLRASQSQMTTFMPPIKFLAKAIFKNKSLLSVTLAYALSNSWTWTWYQMLEVTLFVVGFPQQVGMDCRFWLLVHTCVLALSVGWFADQFGEHNKRLSLVIQFLATACLLWVVCTLHVRSYHQNTTELMVGIVFAFPLSWTTQSLMYEMAAQHAYPLPENIAVGVLEVTKIASEICAYAFLMFLPKFHLYWLHMVTVVAGTFSFVFLLCVKRDKCKRYTF